MNIRSLATMARVTTGPAVAMMVVWFAASPAAAPADPLALDSWTCRAGCTNLPTDSLYLRNVRFVNGIFMAVGDGIITTSTDGTNWIDKGGAGIGVLRDVAFGNGAYVAVGGTRLDSQGSAVIVSSPNGDTWTPQTAPVTNTLEAVTFANGLFVAVGGLGIILTSADGTSWIDRSITPSYFLSDITFGNGRFVAAANAGIGVTSPDGLSWTATNSGAIGSTLNAVVFGAGLFVGVGTRDSESNYVFTSSDGVGWTPSANSTNSYLQAVAFGGGWFVAGVSRGALLISSNGFAWTLLPRTGVEQHIEGVAFGNGIFVAVKNEQIGMSSDAVNWTWRASPRRPPPPNFSGITFGQGRFVVVGTGSNVFSSADGENWSPHPIGRSLGTPSVAYGNDRFVAAGIPNAVAVSMDGTSWTGLTLGGGDTLHKVVFGNGMFLVAGVYYAHRSTNGYEWWPSIAPGFGIAKQLIFANGWFYLVSDSLARSTNGRNWEVVARNYPGTYAFGAGHGLLVHLGSSGFAGASADGSNWVTRSFPFALSASGLAYANGRFVAVGRAASEAVAVSLDGLNWRMAWTNGSRPDLRRLNAVAFGNNTFVAVGNYAAIFQSGQVGEHLELQTQPQSQTVAVGDTARLSSFATGPLPIQYQWQHDSNDVQFATNASLVLDPALPPHTGNYTVRVTDGVDTVNTLSAKLFVPGALDLWERTHLVSNSLASVLWANGMFVAGGVSSNVLVSMDGQTWTSHNLGFVADLRVLAFGNGTFVGVGGALSGVVTSSNAVTWTRQSTGTNRALNDLVFGGGLFAAIALGWSNVLTSPDGITWTIRPAPAAPLDLTYANGMFVGAAGSNVVISADGLAWNAYPVSPFFLTRIAHGNGMFLALGRSNAISGTLTSTNGVDWVFRRPPVLFFLASSLSFQGGLFVVAPNSSNNGIAVSSDGITWSTHTVSAASNVLNVAFHDGHFVGVSAVGGIYLSEYFGAPRLSGATRQGDAVWLSANGERGHTFRLQRSDQLHSSSWTDLQTILFRTSSTNLSAASPTNASAAYYRLASP